MTTYNLIAREDLDPQPCEFVTFRQTRFTATEYCEADCEPGELYCPAHQWVVADDIGEPEDNWARLDLEDPWA